MRYLVLQTILSKLSKQQQIGSKIPYTRNTCPLARYLTVEKTINKKQENDGINTYTLLTVLHESHELLS